MAETNEINLVKALQWSACKSLVGSKLVARDCFGNEFCRIDYDANSSASIAGLESKKADAQVRYAACILSALSPSSSADLEPLREVLMPFAEAADYYEREWPREKLIDAMPIGSALLLKHVRAARTALAALAGDVR